MEGGRKKKDDDGVGVGGGGDDVGACGKKRRENRAAAAARSDFPILSLFFFFLLPSSMSVRRFEGLSSPSTEKGRLRRGLRLRRSRPRQGVGHGKKGSLIDCLPGNMMGNLFPLDAPQRMAQTIRFSGRSHKNN